MELAVPVLDKNMARVSRDLSPQDILASAVERYRGRIALVSSFGSESAVLLHMISQIDPTTPVLFLDTGQLFAQTLDYRRNLAGSLGLSDVRDLRPTFADLSTKDPRGDLWKSNSDGCCNIRKVIPLDQALDGFDAWITGRKRFHGGERLTLAVEERTARHVKFNPLANWDKAELEAYATEHNLPQHPLVEYGYASVGCWPCTQPVQDGQDVRAGRWAGQDKTECGIHMEPASQRPGADLGEGL